MPFSVEVGSFLLYSLQQLGVVLGVGAQAVLMALYLLATRDGKVDEKEQEFARTVHKILYAGLALIILSGLAVVGLHSILGEAAIIFAPAFLFKWALIGFLIAALFLQGKSPFPNYLGEGVMGATWFALFAVHIVAPVTTWTNLGIAYLVWTTGFMFVWVTVVFLFNHPQLAVGKQEPESKSEDKIVPKPVVNPVVRKVEEKKMNAPKPTPHFVLSTPEFAPKKPSQLPEKLLDHTLAPAPHKSTAQSKLSVPHKPSVLQQHVNIPVPHKPTFVMGSTIEEKKPEELLDLPAIRVMPRTPEEIALQYRPSIVHTK